MNKVLIDDQVKKIMKSNIIGPDELRLIKPIELSISDIIPDIPFSYEILERKKEDYILILGISKFADGSPVTIRNLKKIFGVDPSVNEPCFYNQDWYDNEQFVDIPMKDGWYFIRKNVYEESRAKQPLDLMQMYLFPSAICCTYTFFTAWLARGIKLWHHDFVWCSDIDHNGDRIYVGKYNDVDCINKNGFSIHRQLELRTCYGCID